MCGSRAAFQQNNLQNEQKLSELQKGGSMYKKWLGLEFERVEGARLPPPPPHMHPLDQRPPGNGTWLRTLLYPYRSYPYRF